MHDLGLQIREGHTLRREHKQCSAPAAERAAELQAFLLDPDIAAVMPPWGGERAIEVLPLLDFERLAAAPPKWFSGFSDLSTLQVPLCLRAGWMSAHAPNLMELGAETLDDTTAALLRTLFQSGDAPLIQRSSAAWQTSGPDWSEQPAASLALSEPTRWRRLDGSVEPVHLRGRLIGGCLDTLGRIAGTPFGDLSALAGPHLLFFENAEMGPCELLRALVSFKLHGWFTQAAGVVIGRHAPADTSRTEELSLEDAVRAALGELGVPVLLDADIGHCPPQLSLIQDAWAELDWTADGMEIRQTTGPHA